MDVSNHHRAVCEAAAASMVRPQARGIAGVTGMLITNQQSADVSSMRGPWPFCCDAWQRTACRLGLLGSSQGIQGIAQGLDSSSTCALKETEAMSGQCDSPLHWSFEDAVSTLDCTPDSQIVSDLQFIPPTAVSLRKLGTDSGQQRRLAVHARVSDWKIRREDLEIRNELSRTLHSTLYLADWKGTAVVVKCAGLHGAGMSAQMRKSESQAEQLETEDASDSMVQERPSSL